MGENMKAILLAAGYSKRLGELTENTPKTLLTLDNKTIFDYLIEKLEKINVLNDIYVVTNNKYYKNFIAWKNTYNGRLNIEFLNDLTDNNDERLGAVGDIMLAIKHFNIEDDMLITATDGYFEFELKDMVDYFYKTQKNVVMAKRHENYEELKRFGVATLDENGKIILMEEKPLMPKSNIVVFATYLFKKEILPFFEEYKRSGNNMDAPGNFVSWLYKKTDVFAYVYDDVIYDIGTVDSYNYVNNLVKLKHNK